jgi:hypothetical protein
MIDQLVNTFLNKWPTAKSDLKNTMQANKQWNSEFRINKKLATSDQEYKQNKKKNSKYQRIPLPLYF